MLKEALMNLVRTAKAGILAAGLTAPSALADVISCQARVGLNRIYEATFDTDTGDVQVRNDAGSDYKGQAAVSLSGTTGNTKLFLPTAFGSGLEIEVEAGAQARIALCLADNECYLCRRR